MASTDETLDLRKQSDPREVTKLEFILAHLIDSQRAVCRRDLEEGARHAELARQALLRG